MTRTSVQASHRYGIPTFSTWSKGNPTLPWSGSYDYLNGRSPVSGTSSDLLESSLMTEFMITTCPVVDLIVLKVGHKNWTEAASEAPPADSVLSPTQWSLRRESLEHICELSCSYPHCPGGQNVVGGRTVPSKAEGSTLRCNSCRGSIFYERVRNFLKIELS